MDGQVLCFYEQPIADPVKPMEVGVCDCLQYRNITVQEYPMTCNVILDL